MGVDKLAISVKLVPLPTWKLPIRLVGESSQLSSLPRLLLRFATSPARNVSQGKGQLGDFLVADGAGMASGVADSRKRSSLSCEVGKPDIADSLGGAALLSSAIADFIIKKGLPYSLSNDPLLERVIKAARTAPQNFKPPQPKEIGGRYLDVSSARYDLKNAHIIEDVAKKYGYSMMSDGATVKHYPLVNVLGGVPNALPVMLEIADCTPHMQEGGKKDGMFLASLMKKHADQHSPRSCFLWLLDGASNEQAAGDMLEAAMPWSTKVWGAEHLINKICGAICAIPEVKMMVDDELTMYNFFTARHLPRSLLVKQSATFNSGTAVSLFHAAGNRMAGQFIAFHKSFRLKAPLQAVVSSSAYLDEKYGDEDLASPIVKDEFKWKKKFLVLRTVWPLVSLLRTVDSNTPSMGVLFNACLRVEKHFRENEAALDEVFDPDADDYEDKSRTVFNGIRSAYEKYSPHLKHDWAKLGFLTEPTLIDCASDYPDQGDLLLAAERVVRKIYHGDANIDRKLSEFSVSLAAFRAKSGSFSRGFIWSDAMLTKGGHAHEWHDIYTAPFHTVFGDVARKVQAQLTGPGGGERNWQKLKFVWDSKRHRLFTEKAEKEVRIYEGHCREMAQFSTGPSEMPLHRMWLAAEVEFDLGLDKYGVTVDMEATGTPKFKCYERSGRRRRGPRSLKPTSSGCCRSTRACGSSTRTRTKSTSFSQTTSSGRRKLARTPRRRATWSWRSPSAMTAKMMRTRRSSSRGTALTIHCTT